MHSSLYGLRLYEYPMFIGPLVEGGCRKRQSVETGELFESVLEEDEKKTLFTDAHLAHKHHPHLHNKKKHKSCEDAILETLQKDENASKSKDELYKVEKKSIFKSLKEKIGSIPFVNQKSHLKLVKPVSEEGYLKFTISPMPLYQKSFDFLEDIWKLEAKNTDLEFNRKLLRDIDQKLHQLKDCTMKQSENLSQVSSDPIKDYMFEYTGLMLMISHYLYECRDRLAHNERFRQHIWFVHDPKANIESLEKRGQAVLALLELALSLEEKREERHLISPFIDDLNLEDFEHFKDLDISGVLIEMGLQYSPQTRRFLRLMVRVTASKNYSDSYSDHNKLVRSALFGSANVFYTIFKDDAARGCRDFFKNVDVERGKSLWDLSEMPVLQRLMYSSLPSMKVSSGFTIDSNITAKKKEADEEWRSSLDNARTDATSDHLKNQKVIQTSNSHHEQQQGDKAAAGQSEEQLQKIIAEKTADGQISMEDFDRFASQLHHLLPHDYPHSHIRLKLISDAKSEAWDNLNLQRDHPWLHFFKSFASSNSRKDLFGGNPPTVIVFVHGGGFISMSPSSHSAYTFSWAKELKIPVVAIDYRKAPDSTFPTQVEECFTVYEHILHNSQKMFGSDVKIILAGDSAGGNLIQSMCLKAIHKKERVPDAMCIFYPASYVAESPSPARLLSLTDPLVNLAFLKLCGTAYPHRDSCTKSNPFLSPIVSPDEILKQFPPCYISVGALDPLFDDAAYLAKRLNKFSEKVCLNVYHGLGHGFLNLTTLVPEARQANDHAIEWMQEIMNKWKKEAVDGGTEAQRNDAGAKTVSTPTTEEKNQSPSVTAGSSSEQQHM